MYFYQLSLAIISSIFLIIETITHNVSLLQVQIKNRNEYIKYIFNNKQQYLKINKIKNKVTRMDNIEIKKVTTKRTMQSLLEESAIDNSYNHEAQELRQAYTKTIKDLHSRIKDLQKTITKLQIEIKQKDEIILEQYQTIGKKENKIGAISAECEEVGKANIVMKKRLQHLEYKIETIQNNRREVMEVHLNAEDKDNKILQRQIQQTKKHLYSEVRQILQSKISRFVKQMKKQPMNQQLQQSIEAFLEDILYINPNENRVKAGGLFEEEKSVNTYRNRRVGKISGRGERDKEKLSEMDEWKKMEKSLEKLKNVSPLNRNNPTRTQDYNRSRPDHSPMHKPLINYI